MNSFFFDWQTQFRSKMLAQPASVAAFSAHPLRQASIAFGLAQSAESMEEGRRGRGKTHSMGSAKATEAAARAAMRAYFMVDKEG